MSHIFDVGEIAVGDVVAYTGSRYDRSARVWFNPTPTDREWLRVSRVDDEGVHGYRVSPEDWEREIEFVIVPAQIVENGVMHRG